MRQRHLETTERCSEMVADFMADNEKRSKCLISEIEVSTGKIATSNKKELIQLPHLPDAEKTAPSASVTCPILLQKMQFQEKEGRNLKT